MMNMTSELLETVNPHQVTAESDRLFRFTFLSVISLTSLAAALLLVRQARHMGATRGMPMPTDSDWTSMWAFRSDEGGLGAFATFVEMWFPMTVAMMLPSLAPILWKVGRSVSLRWQQPSVMLLTATSFGYFGGWLLFGVLLFLLLTCIATVGVFHPKLAKAMPIATGPLIMLAGCLQLAPGKSLHLRRCRRFVSEGPPLPHDLRTAWRYGFQASGPCIRCCLSFTLGMLPFGMMNLGAMLATTAAISAERLAPNGRLITRLVGVSAVCFGLYITLRQLFV